ncbi:MAG: hypothetical protein AAGE93_10840 [Bacteroidota bacterium]
MKKLLHLLCFYLISNDPSFAQSLDEYGGYTKIKGTKTGQWHTENIDGRKWFVTPAGNAMYVLGINHIEASSEDEKQQTLTNLAEWNFNSSGYGAPIPIIKEFPGFISVRIHDAPHWLPADRFGFADVFGEAFAQRAARIIREKCAIGKDNTRVIGYSLTDTPRYDLDIVRARRGNDWVSAIRKLPAETAGKKRYVAFLKERYNEDFNKFKTAYRLESVNSFDNLLNYSFTNLELVRPAIRQDDEAFLAIIAEKIYQLTREYFDQYDPDALLLSEKFKIHDHPEEILKLAGKYFDVISIQPGPTTGPDVGQGPDESVFDPSYWKGLYELTGKPVMIMDHGASFHTPEYPRTLWHQFHSEKRAADFYDQYVKQVISEPYILGYLKCQYQSRYDPLRTLLKQGLLDMNGEPYPTITEQVAKTNQAVYQQLYR